MLASPKEPSFWGVYDFFGGNHPSEILGDSTESIPARRCFSADSDLDIRLLHSKAPIKIEDATKMGTAEPLDKNRLRIFQPTLGFLSAIGGKYGNYERGYPQVLNLSMG